MSSSEFGEFSLKNKVALVTGSGRGIGAGIAKALGRRGASVVVNYAHSREHAQKVVEEIEAAGSKAVAFQADVSDVAQTAQLMQKAVEHFGKLDIVASNSGVVSFGHLKDVTPEVGDSPQVNPAHGRCFLMTSGRLQEFDRVFSINTRGQFFVAREAYKHLSKGGRIILTSSDTAAIRGTPKHAVYSGSKGAIESFVRCMVRSHAPPPIN